MYSLSDKMLLILINPDRTVAAFFTTKTRSENFHLEGDAFVLPYWLAYRSHRLRNLYYAIIWEEIDWLGDTLREQYSALEQLR